MEVPNKVVTRARPSTTSYWQHFVMEERLPIHRSFHRDYMAFEGMAVDSSKISLLLVSRLFTPLELKSVHFLDEVRDIFPAIVVGLPRLRN